MHRVHIKKNLQTNIHRHGRKKQKKKVTFEFALTAFPSLHSIEKALFLHARREENSASLEKWELHSYIRTQTVQASSYKESVRKRHFRTRNVPQRRQQRLQPVGHSITPHSGANCTAWTSLEDPDLECRKHWPPIQVKPLCFPRLQFRFEMGSIASFSRRKKKSIVTRVFPLASAVVVHNIM